MKKKMVFSLIMSISLFLMGYLFFEDRDIPRLVLWSVFSGIALALIHGYLKRLIDYILKRILKSH